MSDGSAVNSRSDFIGWLRRRRGGLVGGPDRDVALSMLGLDDAHLGRWEAGCAQVTSLPHASPNVFFPRVGVAWFARHLQERDPQLLHLRVTLTHVNFSDLGWRPYAWWYVDNDKILRRSTQFTRNKKAKHVVVASQGPLAAVPASTCGVQAEAARLATQASDRSISYMLIMAAEERAAGLAVADRTVYLPLSLLVEYATTLADATHARADARWLAALLASASGRRIAPDGRLAAVEDTRYASVLDNTSNIALLSLLGGQQVIGGAKMAAYWHGVEARCRQAGGDSGVHPATPEMARLPEVKYDAHVAASGPLAAQLAAAEVGYSQGMALVEHERFAERCDPFTG
jgi:hypothetical protein